MNSNYWPESSTQVGAVSIRISLFGLCPSKPLYIWRLPNVETLHPTFNIPRKPQTLHIHDILNIPSPRHKWRKQFVPTMQGE